MGIGLSQLFAASGLEKEEVGQDHHLANSMGLFLQKTNIIRDYLEDIVQGREFWPREVCVWGCGYVGEYVTEGLQYRPKHSDESVVLISSYTLLLLAGLEPVC